MIANRAWNHQHSELRLASNAPVTAKSTVEISLERSQNREMGRSCSEYFQFTGAPTVVGADQRVALTLYTVLVGATTIKHVQILSHFYHWLVKAVFELNDSRDFGLCEWLTLTTTLPSEELLSCTVESPNNGHFGTQASVLYSGYVPYWGVLVKPPPTNVLIIVC